jgi:hypothetical protein
MLNDDEPNPTSVKPETDPSHMVMARGKGIGMLTSG